MHKSPMCRKSRHQRAALTPTMQAHHALAAHRDGDGAALVVALWASQGHNQVHTRAVAGNNLAKGAEGHINQRGTFNQLT